MTDLTADERIRDYGRLVETQRRLHRLFGRSIRDQGGLSMVWYEALIRLARSPEGHLSINELGHAMDLTSGGATRLVDRLEEEGLVARAACPTDRRVQWIGLTATGRATLNAATSIHLDDIEEHFSSRLTPTEADTLRRLLRKLLPEEER